MHNLTWALLALLLLGATSASPQAQAQERARTTSGTQTMTPPQETNSLVCNLEAMTSAQRQRHDRIGQQLRHAAQQIKELPDGYAFRFAYDPTLFRAAAELITLESRCCSFYHFSLEQEPRGGAIWLRITGPKDAKSFIKQALAP